MKMIHYVGKQLSTVRINVSTNDLASIIKFTNKDGIEIFLPISRTDLITISGYITDCLDGKGDSY